MSLSTTTGVSAWQDRYARAHMNTFGTPRTTLVRGEGCYVWDADGNRYLDLLAGIAVNVLGHAHPALVEAVTEQLSELGHVSNFFSTPPQVQLCERLLSLLGTDGRVFLSNSGTEANEAAFKLTRRTGRTKVVAATGGFHGRTMGALALTAKAAYRDPFAPLPGDVVFVEYGDEAALRAVVDDDTAAVVLEPVQGEAGAVVPPAGYLTAARRITAEHDALLWFDEVQSGIGRTGRWFAHQRESDSATTCVPDVVTLAKGLGGGIPVGATIAVGGAADLLAPGNHGTTFGGNPVAAAAALATLRVIEDDDLLGNARAVGDRLMQRTRDLAHPCVGEVHGAGLLIGVDVVGDVAKPLTQAAQSAGFIVNDCTPSRIRLAPPLVLRADQADDWLAALPTLLDEVAR
ncbi:MAG TPA: acetylornithine transaminase [Nocardioidaceae bacterium]|nr:acetylornithine transaminase [Nocardioidaceae bacterium]